MHVLFYIHIQNIGFAKIFYVISKYYIKLRILSVCSDPKNY